MNIRCDVCDWERDVPRRVPRVRALYKCHTCRQPVTTVSVFTWAEELEALADQLEERRQAGRLGTRKQSTRESDRDISAAGVGAELAACVILAPWKLKEWMQRTGDSGANRGEDFPAAWFPDGRALEIKYTARCGHLLVRPPANTPGPMRAKYIDDSIYVLMTGKPYTYTAVGWAGRSDILKRGRLNPIPIKARQRECWGIHADDLNPMSMLFHILYRDRNQRALKRGSRISSRT